MHREHERQAVLEHTLLLHHLGLRLLPLVGKVPMVKGWPDLCLDERDIIGWNERGVNWGIITGEPLVVIDTDTAAAEAWVQANLNGADWPVLVRSGRGGLHRYTLAAPDCEIRSRHGLHSIPGLDIKGTRGYIVAAGSIHPETHERYAYVPGKELTRLEALPTFDPHWLEDPRMLPSGTTPHDIGSGKKGASEVHNLRAYIRAIPSIQGQNGSKACFRVACLLLEAGLDFDQALRELEAWNKVAAQPQWSRRELIHKLESASKRLLRET